MTKFVRPRFNPHAAQSGGRARRSALRQGTHRLRVGLLLLAAALLVSGCVLALPGGWGGVAGLVSALLALGLAACTSSGGGSSGGDSAGFVITGAANNDYAGFSVSWAGDVNGDGIGDIAVGATSAGSRGEAYIIFGRDSGDAVDIGGLASSDGLTASGSTSGGYSNNDVGTAVAWAGDINNDGIDDFAVGDTGLSFGDGFDTGGAIIVFGGDDLPSDISLAAIANNPGTNGMAVVSYSSSNFANTGATLAGVGDLSGDGIDDLLVGSPGSSEDNAYSAASLLFGRNGQPSNRSIQDFYTYETDGIVIAAAVEGIYDYETGKSVALIGDTNDDGDPDIAVGAPDHPFDEGAYGSVFVIFGPQSTYVDTDYNSGSYEGFRIEGASGEGIGEHVSGAGDLNGDGNDDILVGSPYRTSNNGGAYVIFGGRADDADVDVDVMAASTGFTITGAAGSGYAGESGTGVGDVNGDGIDDLLIGAPRLNEGAGAVYLIFGKSGSSGPGNINLGDLSTAQGVAFEAAGSADYLGYAIDASGDVNGDGIKDILVSAPGASNGKGRVYVIFGGDLSHFEDLLGN